MTATNPYYLKRTVDRIVQANNYLKDAVQFLAKAANELDPPICAMCPKEAVYFYGAAQACEEHAPEDIRTGKLPTAKEIQEAKDKVIIEPIKENK